MPIPTDSVTAAEIIRNFGYWQQQALTKPLTVTHHGRARVLLISADEYEKLRANGAPAEANAAADPLQPKLTAVLDNMAEGFILVDKSLRLVEINRVAEAFYGLDRTSLVGQSLAEIFPDSTHAFIVDWVMRVLRTGEIATFETSSFAHPDRKISARVFPIRDQIAIVFQNISEQERLRDQASEWRACWDVMSQHGGVSVSKLDGRGRVLSSDPEFTMFTGFSASELSHVKLFDIVSPAYRKRLMAAFEDVMLNRQPVHLDVQVMVKHGEERMVHVALAPLTRDFVAHAVVMLMAEPGHSLAMTAEAA